MDDFAFFGKILHFTVQGVGMPAQQLICNVTSENHFPGIIISFFFIHLFMFKDVFLMDPFCKQGNHKYQIGSEITYGGENLITGDI